MSLVDAFAKEDRTEVKFSQFFALVQTFCSSRATR